MQVSKYFKQSEFDCKCGCGQTVHSPELFQVLDDVREHFGVPVTINSGKRCIKRNQQVRGAPNSRHVVGDAADITVKCINPSKVHEYLTKKYPDKYGIGKYKTFTHIDVRAYKSRWDMTGD